MPTTTTSSHTPRLRFPGFSGNWEVKKLGKIVDVRDGTHDSPTYQNTGFPLVTSKNLSNDGNIDLTNISYISEEDYISINKRSGVEIGDILFGMIGTIGNPVIVKKSGFAIKNVALIKETKDAKNGFLIHWLNSKPLLKQFHVLNTGGTQKFIALGEIRNLNINLPTLPEQTKIASFLSAVDDKISSLTDLISARAQYKSGMMSRIFSQEIRFLDDHGQSFPEREKKKLESVLISKIDNRGKTPPVSDQGIPLIEVNAIGNKKINFSVINKYVSEYTYSNRFRQHLQMGDVLFSTVGATGLCSYYDGIQKCCVAQNIVGLRFKEGMGEFMFYLLTHKPNNNKFKEIEMGAVQPSVKVSQMIHLKFDIPSLPEQIKIANFLSHIDHHISDLETQIETAKQRKKGLLQGLFI